MPKTAVIWQTARSGGGSVWVRRPRGTWRRIDFDSGPGRFQKMTGLSAILSRISGVTTSVRPSDLAVQAVDQLVNATPLVPRAGPVPAPVAPQGP